MSTKTEINIQILERLAKKGLKIRYNIYDAPAWQKLIKADPHIPRSFLQLRRLGQQIYGTKEHRPVRRLRSEVVPRGVIRRLFEECGEELYFRFYAGLGNPFLTRRQRSIVEEDLDDATPSLENSTETDHFILRWTNSSDHAADNIADSDIVTETGGFLETAWAKYDSAFDRTPYIPAGDTKMEVNFYDIAGYGLASPPDSPIVFDAESWVNIPGIRQPSSAHELFHKLQYAYGYRTVWSPSGDYKWFSEGTASWSEVFVWSRISGSYKLEDLFNTPYLNLLQASYRALPFWIFFETRQKDTPDDNPLLPYLQEYERTGDELNSADTVIDQDWPANNVYGQMDTFFALFSRERRIGAWRQTPWGGQPYSTILDPDDNNIIPQLQIVDILLGAGDSYNSASSVTQYGSDYYRFKLASDTDGLTLTISVEGVVGGDYSYYLIWEKDDAFTKAVFPFASITTYGFTETVDLDTANSVMIIISGRGIGGAYTINSSVS